MTKSCEEYYQVNLRCLKKLLYFRITWFFVNKVSYAHYEDSIIICFANPLWRNSYFFARALWIYALHFEFLEEEWIFYKSVINVRDITSDWQQWLYCIERTCRITPKLEQIWVKKNFMYIMLNRVLGLFSKSNVFELLLFS